MTSPVVTDEMLGDAIRAYNRAYCTKDQVWDDAMRAAITAALEASGEIERLRAALKDIIAAHNTGRYEPLQAAIEAALAKMEESK